MWKAFLWMEEEKVVVGEMGGREREKRREDGLW